MLVQSPSRIIKTRFCREERTRAFRKASRFSGKEAFRSLKACDEMILFPLKEKQHVSAGGSWVFVLPLYGKVLYEDSIGGKMVIIPEQLRPVYIPPDGWIRLSNPHKSELANYLLLEWDYHRETEAPGEIYDFSLEQRNNLTPIIPYHAGIPAFIGLYDGRKEDNYMLSDQANGIFVFILNGAFEVQNRLLENRDAIMLWDLVEVEWEALSENALLLMFEVPSAKEENLF